MSVYTQMVRMSDYLYKIEYPSLDYEHAYRYFRNHFDVGSVLGACSAVYSDNGFFGKNMDTVYDESVSFVVVNRFGNYDTIGIAGGIPELSREVVENEEYTPMYRVLPFMLNSGMNSAGVYAGLNTVYSGDAGETIGTNPTSHRRVNVLMLVRYLLDRCGTAKEAVWKLQLLDIYCPHTVDRNEEYHLMIGDKDECYAVEFIDNKVVVTQLAEHKWLTNYYRAGAELDFMGMLDWTTLTPHARGTRRSDIIAEKFSGLTEITEEQLKYLMRADLAYTATYTMSDRHDEYCGVYDTYGDLTQEVLNTNPSAFSGIASEMTSKYMSRVRGITDTMQTATSTVYNIVDKTINIVADEDGKEFALDISGFDIGLAVSMAPCGGLMFDANQFFMKETPDGQPYVAMNSEQHVMDDDYLKRARTDGKSLYITDRYDKTLRYDPPIMDVTKEPAVYNEEKLVVTKNDASKVEYEAPLADAYIDKEDKRTYLEILKKDGTKVRFDSVDMRIVEFTSAGDHLESDTSIDEILAEPEVMWIGLYQKAYYQFDFNRRQFERTMRDTDSGMSAVETITSQSGTAWKFRIQPINPSTLTATEYVDAMGESYYKLSEYQGYIVGVPDVVTAIGKGVDYVVDIEGISLSISNYDAPNTGCMFTSVGIDPTSEQVTVTVLYPDETEAQWWRKKVIVLVDGVLPIDFEKDGLYLRNTYIYGNIGLFKYVLNDRRLALARYRDQYYALTACYIDDSDDTINMTFSRTFYDVDEDMWKVEEIYKREEDEFWDIRVKELKTGDKFIIKGDLDSLNQFVVDDEQDITDAFYAHEHGEETAIYIARLNMYAEEVKTETGYITYNLAQANIAPHFITVKIGEDLSVDTQWKNVVTLVNPSTSYSAIQRYVNNSFEVTYQLSNYSWKVDPTTGYMIYVSGKLDYQGIGEGGALTFGGTCTAFGYGGILKPVDVIVEVIDDYTAHNIIIKDADGEFVIVEATSYRVSPIEYNANITPAEGLRLLNAVRDNYPVALIFHNTPTKDKETDKDTYMWFNGITLVNGDPIFHFMSHMNGRVDISYVGGTFSGKWYYPDDRCIYVITDESEYDDIPDIVLDYEAVYYKYAGNKEIIDQGETRLFTFEGELPYQQSFSHAGLTTHVFSGDVMGVYAGDNLVKHPYELTVLIDEGSTTTREIWTRIESSEKKYYAFKQEEEMGAWIAVDPFDYDTPITIDPKDFYYDILEDNADVWLFFEWDTISGADGHVVRVPALQWIKEDDFVAVKCSWDDIVSKNRINLYSDVIQWNIIADTKPNLDNVTFTGTRTNTTWTWRKWDGTAVTERDIQRTCDLATHVGLHIWVTDDDGVARDYVMDFGNSEQISSHEYLYRFEGYTPEKHRLGDLSFIYDTDTKTTTALDFSSRNVLDEVGAQFLITQPPTIDSQTWIIEDKDGNELSVDDILAECEDGKSPRLWVYGLLDKVEPDMRLTFTSKHKSDAGEVYYFNGSGLQAVAEFTVTVIDDGSKVLSYSCNTLSAGGGTKQFTSIHDSTKEDNANLIFNGWKQMFTDLGNGITCNMYVKGDDTIKEEGRALNYSGNTPYGTGQKIHTWKHATSQTVATLTAIENTTDHTLVSYTYEIKPVGETITVEAKVIERTGALVDTYYLDFEEYTADEVMELVDDGKTVTIHAVYENDTGYDVEWYLPFSAKIPHAGRPDNPDYMWAGNSVAREVYASELLSGVGTNEFTFKIDDNDYRRFRGELDLSGFNLENNNDGWFTYKSGVIKWLDGDTVNTFTKYLTDGGTKAYLKLHILNAPWKQGYQALEADYWKGFTYSGYAYSGFTSGVYFDNEEWSFECDDYTWEWVPTTLENSKEHPERFTLKFARNGSVKIVINRTVNDLEGVFRNYTDPRTSPTYDITPWVNNYSVPTTKAVFNLVVGEPLQVFATQPNPPYGASDWSFSSEDGSIASTVEVIEACLKNRTPKIWVYGLASKGQKDMKLTYSAVKENVYYFTGINEDATGEFTITVSETGAHSYTYEYTPMGGGAKEWNASETYKANDQVWVKGADGKYNYYFSRLDNNKNNYPPENDTVYWSLVSDNMVTVYTMPEPSKRIFDNGLIYKYAGETTADFAKGQEYVCIADGSNYIWQIIPMIPSYITMPTASKKIFGIIVKYTGSDDGTYTKGHLYECILESSAYKWKDLTASVGEPPNDNMYGGTYESSQTYTDGKIRFEPQNDSKANTINISYISRRSFLLQGSFSCSKATVNNWFTIGYFRYNNQRCHGLLHLKR